MWKKSSLLDDVTDSAAQGDGIPLRSCTILHEYRPFLGHQKPIYEPEQRRFAAAAASQEDECFACVNFERNSAYDVEC
jgi:hypothetical protein